MKKLFMKLTCLLPLLVIMISINYIYDPANIFHKGIIDETVDMIKKGYHVEGLVDYDERLFQERFINAQDYAPEVIAVGSSRIMQLCSEDIGKSFLNHGMSGAGIYDYMGILGVYEFQNMMPRTVLIGADPWILNENNGETRFLTLTEYIQIFQGESEGSSDLKQNKIALEEKKQLISPAYFQAAIKQIGKKSVQPSFYETSVNETDGFLRRVDGSTSYEKKIRMKTVEQVNAEAYSYVSEENIYQLQNYNELSVELKDKFELLVGFLNKKNIKVVIYLPPYHPYVYQYIELSHQYQCVLEAEAYFRQYAREHQIEIYGSYNPKHSGCDDTDFLDGMHLKAESVLKSFANNE